MRAGHLYKCCVVNELAEFGTNNRDRHSKGKVLSTYLTERGDPYCNGPNQDLPDGE